MGSLLVAALEWVRAHKQVALAAALVLVAFTAGRCSVSPPQPALVEKLDTHAASDSKSASDVTKKEGSSHTVTLDFAPLPCGSAVPARSSTSGQLHKFSKLVIPAQDGVSSHSPAIPDVPDGEYLARETITDTGPIDTETKAATEQHAVEDKHLELKLTPQAPRPGWEVGIGVEGGIDLGHVRFAARRRLMGDLWIEVSARPLQRDLGAGLALSF